MPERRSAPPMTDKERRVFLWFAVGRMMVLVILVIAVFMQSYYGRKDLVNSQRSGCERGKLDRNDNAKGWRSAEAARRASGTPSDLRAAAQYDRIASSLEHRAGIDCDKVFPSASPLEGFGR